MDIKQCIKEQKTYFQRGHTLSLKSRLQALDSLEQQIRLQKQELLQALAVDLAKPAQEAYMTEIAMILTELRMYRRHLASWMKPQKRPTPISAGPGRSRIIPRPYGVVLIMSPWNYPLQLSLIPLISALAAGNCAIVKPSEDAPASAAALAAVLKAALPPQLVQIIQGGREINRLLLQENFDYIFFTGGATMGRIVMTQAAASLIPVTLELGGKSPCLITEDADLDQAAKRILFGKLLNAGQTCVAPDYVLVPRNQGQAFVSNLENWLKTFFAGQNPLFLEDWPKIITPKHFQRLLALLQDGNIAVGGDWDEKKRKIQPTILYPASFEQAAMQEEIFGPLLPVIPYDNVSRAIEQINARPHPLALYVFCRDKKHAEQIFSRIPCGGGCVNDTIMHLVNLHLPFGGVGESGMGAYHGKTGCDTFSHYQSIFYKSSPDWPLRYRPYTPRKRQWIEKLLK